MSIIKGVWFFYKKLIVPSTAFSVAIGMFAATISEASILQTIGISYFTISLPVLFYVYEIRNPNEYYFYYNLGLSKPMLWASTALLSLFICIILSII